MGVNTSVAEGKEWRPTISGDDDPLDGLAALQSYLDVLNFLEKNGRTQRPPAPAALPFLQNVAGLKNLFHSMSAVAPAVPDTRDEEWNPLSQRPHSPLPPRVTDELGAEITALKAAVDEFTILSHEMMHIALWELFFVGSWRPRNRQIFRTFSLMAEGFCYFFSDIVVSGAVRVRLPDGEFALDRQTPSNARFHPVRAFQALGMGDHATILDIYLEGFRGQSTRLWQPRGASPFAASLAAQAYAFYAGSQPLLDGMHAALTAFGGLTEFYQRFCAVPGLPSFLIAPEVAEATESDDLKSYFVHFFKTVMPRLVSLSAADVARVKWRRMLQMRAYYALQVRWLLGKGEVVARAMTASDQRKAMADVDVYLDGLQTLLRQMAHQGDASVVTSLARLDARYNRDVRAKFLTHEVWAGQRWLIAPRRAGGSISLKAPFPTKDHEAKRKISQIVAFLIEELTTQLGDCKTVGARAKVFQQIQRVAAIGAGSGSQSAERTREAVRQLKQELRKPHLLPLWSLPLASFDPVHNRYRELVFSYQ